MTATVQTASPAPAATEGGRARRVGRRVVLTLVTLLPFALTASSFASLLDDHDGGVHRFHDLSHTLWLGLLVWAPYALQWHRPARKVALWQGAAIGAAVLLAGGLAAGVDDPVFFVAFPLFAALVALTHPARSRLLRGGAGLSPVLAPLAAVAAVPASVYAVAQLELQRTMSDDVHGELIHYAGQALVVLFAVLFAAVASIRTPGWQWAAGLATATGLVLGLGSLADLEQSGAFPAGAAVGVVLLSTAYGAAAVWEHRRG